MPEVTLAVDLCAGSGWAVACQWLGISELGFEIMPEAIGTRDAMGVLTQMIERNGKIVGMPMEEIPDAFCRGIDIQIAGPPCQTFSAAGKGEGRAQLAEIVRRIMHLQWFGVLIRGGDGDPRTWLVLEPLRLALGGLPTYIVWEQVPGVLPVWQACEPVLTEAGYSTWTGILRAEQYGVPQTRKRAFLIARRDGKPAGPPPVTHSRYHERDPGRLDPGVLPWVSMAEALGWGTTGRPSFTVTGGGASTGGAEPCGRRARESLLEYRSSIQPNATIRTEDQPAPTILFGNDAASVHWAYRNGNQANAAERSPDQPSPTIHFGARTNDVRWVQRSNYSSGGKGTPSPVLGSPPLGKRELYEPSSTITGKVGKWANEGDAQSIRVSVAEAAVLQTFPPGHPFQGASGKQYLQIGNAVPPVLAWHILRTFVAA